MRLLELAENPYRATNIKRCLDEIDSSESELVSTEKFTKL